MGAEDAEWLQILVLGVIALVLAGATFRLGLALWDDWRDR